MTAMNELPPVVYGDPTIDAKNAYLWSLEVPENSDLIQRLQREVIELERAHNEAKERTGSHATHD